MAYITLTGAYSLNGNGRLNVGGSYTTSGTTTTYTQPSSTAGQTGDLGGFKSGSISFDASSVDNSTRGDGGWAINAPGVRSATIELTWNKLETDHAQDELVDMLTFAQADWQGKGIAVAYLSADTTGTNKSGFCGTFVPTAYSENQTGGGDNDATAVECSMTLVSYGPVCAISDIAVPS